MIPEWFWLATTAVLGLVMGSAVTAIAYRIPRDRSWVSGRSACPACGTTLGVLDLVPVLSWALARGRCRHCGATVSWRYPLTELMCAAWAVLLYLRIGIGWDYPFLALWGFLLIALLWIDLDFQLLPDVLTFPGTLIGVAAAALWPGGIREAIFGVLLGSGLLWLLGWLYQRIRGTEGMGGGDIKLAAMFGVVLGWPLTLFTLFLAAAIGSVWGGILMLRGQGDGRTAIPFGTLLAPAAMVAFLWGPRIIGAWIGLLIR
jgi:leader peptidase (prepilin peptidase) / N-methyltransferase